MMSRTIRRILIVASVILLIFTVFGCRNKKGYQQNEQYSSDQMWKDRKLNDVVCMFKYDDTVYMADSIYPIRYGFDESALRSGGFYKVTADITYLNGGVAGYVNYPEINSVNSIEEISPFDLNLPSITEKQYGLTLIGDYADGAIFLNESGLAAVWEDGEWIWRYDRNNSFKTDDGSIVYMASGISKEEILENMESGVLSCEDYFVVPAAEQLKRE